MLTLKAKNIVAKYESSGNAQVLFKNLVLSYKESVKQDQIVSMLRKNGGTSLVTTDGIVCFLFFRNMGITFPQL